MIIIMAIKGQSHYKPLKKVVSGVQETATEIVSYVNAGSAGLTDEFRKFKKNSGLENLYPAKTEELSLSDFFSDKLFMVYAIRNGIPYSLFELIRDMTPLTLSEWAEYLNISGKSLSRYRQQNTLFKPIYAEKILEVAEVTNLGLEVFGNREKLKLWFETPNYALGNQKPFDLLKDSYGKEMVLGELTRIDHGILV